MTDKDLFDDSTMTFGEHLEALRMHLWKAIVGWLIATVAAFWISQPVIIEMQRPVNSAMKSVFIDGQSTVTVTGQEAVDKATQPGVWDSARRTLNRWLGREEPEPAEAPAPPPEDPAFQLKIDGRDVARALHAAQPGFYPELPADAPEVLIAIPLADQPFGKFLKDLQLENMRPRTDGVDEAFMIYLKVSLVVGFILASPWIFFQLWQFVAAGLYPNERRYVYRYLPLSIGLFLAGVVFCYYVVIPFMLTFLFKFNVDLAVRPEIKIGTWIMFALVVSLMFGLSFQLPLVMVVLDRIHLVPNRLYSEHRRWAILIIAFLSMVLTPADPISMLAMMIPLLVLYEFGILLCRFGGGGPKNPFEMQTA
ncbi:MAG: twin-arginine translocase subunit TatC [Planctomycetaceae bacterium]